VSGWRVAHGVGHFTGAVSGRALPADAQKQMLQHMNRNEKRHRTVTESSDTQGHRLVVLDRPAGRKASHMAELERELRLRRQAKESRSNRPDRY